MPKEITKDKRISLRPSTIRYFSIEAAKKGTTAKPYIEQILENIANAKK